jgi:hypothetical protein
LQHVSFFSIPSFEGVSMNLFEVTIAIKQAIEDMLKTLNQEDVKVHVTADFNPSYIRFHIIREGSVKTYSIQILEQEF